MRDNAVTRPMLGHRLTPKRRPNAGRHTKDSMMVDELFPRLLVALKGHSAQLCALYALLYRHGAHHDVAVSYRDFTSLNPMLTRMTAVRALADLVALGLVSEHRDPNVPPNNPRRYRVHMDRLEALVRQPLPEAVVIPGITPIPALDELAERLSHSEQEDSE